MPDGVLFDYSSTLFRLDLSTADDGDPDRTEQLVNVLTATSSIVAERLPATMVDAWHRRDLDPVLHRRVYLAALAVSDAALTPDEAETLYERMLSPSSWVPYPDTLTALRRLRAAGIPVAVVSNIAWDIRAVFDRHGAADLVDEFVLSYIEGVMKPDPTIFTVACQRLGVPPERTVMIGDSPEADGGAVAVGCRTAFVDPLPVARRPDALLTALDAHDIAA